MSEVECSSCVETKTDTVTGDSIVSVIYDTQTGEEVDERLYSAFGIGEIRAGNVKGRGIRAEVKTASIETDVYTPTKFEGTLEEALAAGWQENEFGLVCTSCAEKDYSSADNGSSGSDLEENPLVAVAVAATLKRPKTEAEKAVGQ